MDDQKLFEREMVQARLDEEAARLNAVRGGSYRFNNIRRYQSASGANWTANFGARAGLNSVEHALDMDDMREALQRVQSEMPEIKF